MKMAIYVVAETDKSLRALRRTRALQNKGSWCGGKRGSIY